jgi:hypothetical protein
MPQQKEEFSLYEAGHCKEEEARILSAAFLRMWERPLCFDPDWVGKNLRLWFQGIVSTKNQNTTEVSSLSVNQDGSPVFGFQVAIGGREKSLDKSVSRC